MLVIFGGRPGSGKSTIAQALARRCGGVYLRIDTIEQAILSVHEVDSRPSPGPAGYLVAYGVAADNLKMGRTVIVDAVNALDITRAAFRQIAARANSTFLEVEVVCTDPDEHRNRVETRTAEIAGHVLPTWSEAIDSSYELWPEADLQIDTAMITVDESVRQILTLMDATTSSSQS